MFTAKLISHILFVYFKCKRNQSICSARSTLFVTILEWHLTNGGLGNIKFSIILFDIATVKSCKLHLAFRFGAEVAFVGTLLVRLKCEKMCLWSILVMNRLYYAYDFFMGTGIKLRLGRAFGEVSVVVTEGAAVSHFTGNFVKSAMLLKRVNSVCLLNVCWNCSQLITVRRWTFFWRLLFWSRTRHMILL